MNSRWSFALALCLVCLLLIATQSAYACPAGTVFSAYNGNAMCAYVGQGATAAVHCTKMVNSCPPGTTHEHKTRGDTGDYCCPTKATEKKHETCVWRGTPPLCNGECEEGERVVDRPGAGAMGCATGSKVYCCR
jgi:hypothetical protein